MAAAGRVVEVGERRRGKGERKGGGLRGTIGGWSAASRRRLLKTVEAIAWGAQQGRPLFVTLTYPGEAGAAFVPTDWQVAKRHLELFRKRWARKWGSSLGVWKLEFQRRGVPHFHLVLLVDRETRVGDVRRWVRVAWWDIVGSRDPAHLMAGTQVDRAASSGGFGAYFAGYARRKSKEYQHELPEGWGGAGRWWGLWGLAPEWIQSEISFDEYIPLRRVLLRHRQASARSRHFRPPAALEGLWRIGRSEGSLARAVMAWFERLAPRCTCGWGGAGP